MLRVLGWPLSNGSIQRQIVFIYSCPGSSPIKHRMMYSSGSAFVYRTASSLLGDAPDKQIQLLSRRIETSDPDELTASHLRQFGLDLAGDTASQPNIAEDKKPFARPRGPAKRRQP